MTADTKAVARWEIGFGGEFNTDPEMTQTDEGDYVSLTDHEREVEDLVRVIDVHREIITDFTDKIDKLCAELDALNEAQAVGDGTISGSLLHWHQRALAAETAVAASRAEVEGLKKDAERYRWLRDADNYPHPVGGFWNSLGETIEPIEMDEQIDAEMENRNV